jgi:hypothetical protein
MAPPIPDITDRHSIAEVRACVTAEWQGLWMYSLFSGTWAVAVESEPNIQNSWFVWNVGRRGLEQLNYVPGKMYSVQEVESKYWPTSVLKETEVFRWPIELGNKWVNVRFEVFTAATMKNGVFRDVTPYGSCKNRRFRAKKYQVRKEARMEFSQIYGPHCQGGHWDWNPPLQC